MQGVGALIAAVESSVALKADLYPAIGASISPEALREFERLEGAEASPAPAPAMPRPTGQSRARPK
eukprot:6178768-Pyramimonas_sp.AAC.1